MKIKVGDIIAIKFNNPKICRVTGIRMLNILDKTRFEEIEQESGVHAGKVLEVVILCNANTGRNMNKKSSYSSGFAVPLEDFLDEKRALIHRLEQYL